MNKLSQQKGMNTKSVAMAVLLVGAMFVIAGLSCIVASTEADAAERTPCFNCHNFDDGFDYITNPHHKIYQEVSHIPKNRTRPCDYCHALDGTMGLFTPDCANCHNQEYIPDMHHKLLTRYPAYQGDLLEYQGEDVLACMSCHTIDTVPGGFTVGWLALTGTALADSKCAGDVAPTLLAMNPAEGTSIQAMVNDELQFSIDGTTDPNHGLVARNWSSFELGSSMSTNIGYGKTVTHAFPMKGTYEVSFSAVDICGNVTTSMPYTVTVDKDCTGNQPPQIISTTPAQGSFNRVDQGYSMQLEATAQDSDGVYIQYTWDFDDNNDVSRTEDPVKIWQTLGKHDVTLRIEDDCNNSVMSSPITVWVGSCATNLAPTINSTIPALDTSVFIGAGNSVDFSADVTDTEGSPINYSWKIDGAEASAAQSFTQVFSNEGIYSVTLDVSDDCQDSTSSAGVITVVVEAAPEPPVADAGEATRTVVKRNPIDFSGSASYDPDNGSIVSYEWNMGDDPPTILYGENVTHTYNAQGNYTVTLTVTDNDGLTGTDTVDVTVTKR